MIIHVGILLVVLSCFKTSDGYDTPIVRRAYWPLQVNSENLAHINKRESDKSSNDAIVNVHQTVDLPSNQNTSDVKQTGVQTEGGAVKLEPNLIQGSSQQTSQANPGKDSNKQLPKPNDVKNTNITTTVEPSKDNATVKPSDETPKTAVNETAASNSTEAENLLQNPGVVKRGLIVFGGFALLAVAYFVFYRGKGKKYDANIHNNTDNNQFRYGVLQSEDRRDNLELSRIPLTMESDEDDEEDLEIFDLEQKRKSLSYVNLQTNDEDVVLHSSNDESKNNLLLDIEDETTDTLINWSNNSKT